MEVTGFYRQFDFSEKTILIMGASSGIGRQTAITLSECGAKTVLVARREDMLRETMQQLSGEGHKYYVADLSEVENIENLMKKIVGECGKLHGLAFCAGISVTRPYNVTDPAIMKKIMQTNFFSFYETVRQFAKKRNSADSAKIVAISSVASLKKQKGLSAYSASKAAMDAVVSTFAQELAPRITINTVHPSFVDTVMAQEAAEMSDAVVTQGTDGHPSGNVFEEQTLGLIPTENVSSMVAYLLSTAADKITGQRFVINAGMNI